MLLMIFTCLVELLFLFSCLSLSRLESCSGGVFQQHVWTGLPRQCRSAAGRAVSRRPQTCPGAPVQPGGEGEPQSTAAYRNSTGSHWVATGWRCEYMVSHISFKIFCLIHRLQMIFALYCVPKSNNNWKCHLYECISCQAASKYLHEVITEVFLISSQENYILMSLTLQHYVFSTHFKFVC